MEETKIEEILANDSGEAAIFCFRKKMVWGRIGKEVKPI